MALFWLFLVAILEYSSKCNQIKNVNMYAQTTTSFKTIKSFCVRKLLIYETLISFTSKKNESFQTRISISRSGLNVWPFERKGLRIKSFLSQWVHSKQRVNFARMYHFLLWVCWAFWLFPAVWGVGLSHGSLFSLVANIWQTSTTYSSEQDRAEDALPHLVASFCHRLTLLHYFIFFALVSLFIHFLSFWPRCRMSMI